MASTFSNLGLNLQATGENSGTWGAITNVNLQEIDNAIYSYNQQKKEGTFVVNLKKLEIEYKTLLEEKNIKSEVLENYFISKKEFDRKLQEIEIKNNDIISKLSKKDLLPTELENYQKQLKVSENNFEEVLSKIDKLQYENKDNLEDYETVESGGRDGPNARPAPHRCRLVCHFFAQWRLPHLRRTPHASRTTGRCGLEHRIGLKHPPGLPIQGVVCPPNMRFSGHWH